MTEPLSPKDLDMILDGLCSFLTDDLYEKHPKKAKQFFDLYQRVGRAIGGKKLALTWEPNEDQ